MFLITTLLTALHGVSASLPSDSTALDSAWAGYARAAWVSIGRRGIGTLAGLQWDSTAADWKPMANWHKADNVGADAYFIEVQLRSYLALATGTGDTKSLDEVAKYFRAYLIRFTTVKDIQAASAQTGGKSKLLPQGPSTDRTLAWKDIRGPTISWPAECILCNSQFLHPAARLVHLIAELPAGQRTPDEVAFVHDYMPLLVKEHLIRIGYETHFPYDVKGAQDDHLIALWQSALAGHAKYRYLDRDLWLIGAGAELLEAHRLDPNLVNLQGEDDRLRRLVTVGVKLLAANRQHHPRTKNLQGRVVGSDGYFEGDFDDHEDYTYSAYLGSDYPAGRPEQRAHGVSWDVSHIQRLPVVLRSLWDSRVALRQLGLTYPDSTDLVQATNQLMYVVFNGDFRAPLLTNYFNGTDGWYRVGYRSRDGYGMPPSRYCNSQNPKQPCLTRNGLRGWGQLAFANPDLGRLIQAVITGAKESSTDAVSYRQRVLSVGDDPTEWLSDPPQSYSQELSLLISEYALGTRP